MTLDQDQERWVWVIVQDPGEKEVFLGQYDGTDDVSFVPAFIEKEDAEQALEKMDRDKQKKYEAQAIKYEVLEEILEESEFVIFILNSKGEILERSDGKN